MMLTVMLVLAETLMCTAPPLYLKERRPGRYSYETCVNATKLWCRHQKLPNGRLMDQADCVAMNARQCADCETVRALRRIRGDADELGSCREWLDGTIVRQLRDMRREFSTE